MLKRVLIANRGEIALRIIRACRELGVETVAVWSQADESALHAQLATRSLCIGPARAADSYLNQDAILSAALATGCDAIHPGYGFLSENPDFADRCVQAGLKYVGPSGDVIRKLGSKSAARTLAQKAGVPVVPGSDGPVKNARQAEALAERPASRHGGGCSQGAGGHDAAAAGGPCAGESGRDYVHVSWRHGVHVKDADSGDEVHVGWDGVHVNDRSYHGWPEAHGDWRPQGWEHGAARGPGVPGASTSRAWRNWNLFPYPLLVVAGYLWLGFGSSEWLAGLMLFATIPVYYALGGLLWGKRACAFFSTLYAMAVVAWFIEMCVMGHPHPAWVAFLTIPLVTWLLNALSHWWQGRKASDRHGA